MHACNFLSRIWIVAVDRILKYEKRHCVKICYSSYSNNFGNDDNNNNNKTDDDNRFEDLMATRVLEDDPLVILPQSIKQTLSLEVWWDGNAPYYFYIYIVIIIINIIINIIA